MTPAEPDGTPVELRPAQDDDRDAIATIWFEGWPDGHLGHVPDELVSHRTLSDLKERARTRIALTTVATRGSDVIGFVTVNDDEIEQVYVAKAVRGSGVADVLLSHGEQSIAERYPRAWLAVVGGNARARRFYERSGWHDEGRVDYAAEIDDGFIDVAVRRYEKAVRP